MFYFQMADFDNKCIWPRRWMYPYIQKRTLSSFYFICLNLNHSSILAGPFVFDLPDFC